MKSYLDFPRMLYRVRPAEQLPQRQHRHRERDRLIALGRRSDSDKRCTLLVVNEADGSWSFHGLGASAGVKLGKADTVALVELILARIESRDPR